MPWAKPSSTTTPLLPKTAYPARAPPNWPKPSKTANLHWFAARQVLRLRDAFYRDLAAKRPSLKVFLEGWRNRVKALSQYLAELEQRQTSMWALLGTIIGGLTGGGRADAARPQQAE